MEIQPVDPELSTGRVWYCDKYNHPETIGINLYDSDGKIVHRDIVVFSPGNRYDIYIDEDWDLEYVPPQPYIYHLEDGIEAQFIEVVVWSVYDPYDWNPDKFYRHVWLSEIDAYTDDNGLTIHGYTDTEAVPRVGDLWNYTDINLGASMDNGDDCHDTSDDRYWSRPRQSGFGRANIHVQNDTDNVKTQRWNFAYSVPVSYEMGCASFEDGDIGDFWEQFWDRFWITIIMLGLTVLICLALSWLNPIDWVFDILAIHMILCEVFSSWADSGGDIWSIEIGYYETKAWFHKDDPWSNMFRAYYYYIADYDGTIARVVVAHEEFDPKYIRFTGEKW